MIGHKPLDPKEIGRSRMNRMDIQLVLARSSPL
jgi:hypothetical protein